MKFLVKHFRDVIIELAAFQEHLQLRGGIHSDIRNGCCELGEIVFVRIESSGLLRTQLGSIACESLCFCYLLRSRIRKGTNCCISPKFYDFASQAIADASSGQSSEGFFQRDIFPSYRILTALDHVPNESI